jgi:peptidoglycan/xylan/chitin deacetylase (PgdA/CDA1 family)
MNFPVTIFIATRQIVEQKNYWFDEVVNALQTIGPISLDYTAYGIGRYSINRTRGAANWGEIECLLTDLKRLLLPQRERVITELVKDIKRPAARPKPRIEPLTPDGVRALARSRFVTIGAHSHCHNILTQLDSSAVEQSVATSKRLLEGWTGKEVWSFAYPNGDFDERIAVIVRRAGFRCAITTGNRLWAQHDSTFGIPRMGIGRYDSLAKFKLGLIGGLRNVARLTRSAAGR